MARIGTFLAAAGLAGVFAWGVPLLRLFGAFQPMTVAVSIMIAAVFVRLNRGMPTLEWKSLDPERRAELTRKIVDVSREYIWIVAIQAVSLVGLVTMNVVGADTVQADWPSWAQRMASGTIGGLAGLCIARMAYVIWRDYDIVGLQKRLIDGTAEKEAVEKQAQLSELKFLDIRAAGLRGVGVAKPKEWDAL